MPWAALLCLALALGACRPTAATGGPAPLRPEREMPLPGVVGRIDHMALDRASGRLYVAALGNGSVEAVDLATGQVAGRIAGLAEPQGVAVVADRRLLAVATGGDGMLRLYDLATLAPRGALKLGADADNVRFDQATGRLVVGYGGGALAVVDPAGPALVGRVPLPAHPEGFQVMGARAVVNLPGAGAVAVADLAVGRLVAQWRTGARRENFPLALDVGGSLAAVVFRLPSRLVTYDVATGAERQALPTCSDADDLFFDAARGRAYVACGDGHVDVFQQGAAGLAPLARVPTSAGARTALFDPVGDRLYVAARAVGGRPAAILVLRPQ